MSSSRLWKAGAVAVICALVCAAMTQLPHATPNGYDLPNGWRITPLGHAVTTEDMVLKLVASPDGRAVIGSHSGFNPHGLIVLDAHSEEAIQRIPLKTTWLGMAWAPDGKTLYVSGGNANGKKGIGPTLAPIYEFTYKNGKLSEQPAGKLDETIDMSKVWWSGLAFHPTRRLLYAANRGVNANPSNIVVFDTEARSIVTRIPVEVNPYELVFSKDGNTLFVSNWASESVSVIDTTTNRVKRVIKVGSNPNDMKLSDDGRLFVACSNDNTVHVIDTKKLQVVEKLSTTITPLAPEGSTPDALAIDGKNHLLYVANADNNSIEVVDITNPEHSSVAGFIPSGWYPSALAVSTDGKRLFIGNSKGQGSYSDIRGPGSPLPPGPEGNGSVKSLQKGSVEIVDVSDLRQKLGRTRSR